MDRCCDILTTCVKKASVKIFEAIFILVDVKFIKGSYGNEIYTLKTFSE